MSNRPTDTPPERALAPTDPKALPERYGARLLAHAWDEFLTKLRQEGTVSGVTGALMLLVTAGLYWYDYAPLLSLIPVFAYAAVLVLFFAYVLFRSPARLDEGRQGKIAGLNASMESLRTSVRELEAKHQSEMKALRRREKDVRRKIYGRFRRALAHYKDLLEPKIEILFGQEYPPEYPYIERTGGSTIYRIAIKNTGGSPLHGVMVKTDGFSIGYVVPNNAPVPYNDLPLRARHEPHPRALSISPGEKVYVNVVRANHDAKQLVELCHSIHEKRQTRVYEGIYHLTFRVTSPYSAPCERKATLKVSNDGHVYIRPDDGQPSGESVQNEGETPNS